jgi:hypothetical protein
LAGGQPVDRSQGQEKNHLSLFGIERRGVLHIYTIDEQYDWCLKKGNPKELLSDLINRFKGTFKTRL